MPSVNAELMGCGLVSGQLGVFRVVLRDVSMRRGLLRCCRQFS
jgi:hypothetical protein